MTTQTFSLEMSRHLYSLVPEFEGHYYYSKRNDQEDTVVRCQDEILFWNSDRSSGEHNFIKKICPAWQAEDVLMNLKEIGLKMLWTPERYMQVGTAIALYLYEFPETAYQKIEEYLWLVLK